MQTPNIDALANRGIKYENFFSNSNATEPCITTILTGHYPHIHGILMHPRASTYEEVSKQKVSEIAEKSHICRLFHEHGWRTYLIDSLAFFNKQYFDEYIEVKEGLRTPDTSEKTTEVAGQILDRAKANSFIFIHYWGTHHPYFPDYSGEVSKLDLAIGRLLEHTKEDDIIIFTADHGESIGEHVTKARESDPGHHHLYDEIIHVPLILSGNTISVVAKALSGCDVGFAMNTSLREQIDIAPTIMDIAEIKHANLFSKRSKSLLLDLNKSEVFLEEHTYQEQLGIRTDNFKFIEKTTDQLGCPLCNVIHGNARCEFYDLKNDLAETFNMAPFLSLNYLFDLHKRLKDWFEIQEVSNDKT